MAVLAERPYSGAHFLVTIGDADSRSVTAGYSEVIFPTFGLDAEHGEDVPELLVLRRGAIGSLDLYDWWNAARRAKTKRPTRPVTIELLADDQRTVAMTWRFTGAYPVSLTYSPLRATESGLVIETIALRFNRVEMA